MGEYAKVYQPDGTYLGTLENVKLQYKLKDVPLHTAKFTLPVDDPKNALCQMGNEIEMFDNGIRVELFRIINAPAAVYKTGGTITYSCEHVLAYLMQDVIFQYLEIGGDGVYTADVLDYLLSLQSVTRWVRGMCDFSLQKQYSFENKTVLQGVLAIPNQFSTEHLWTYDTTVRPFVLNLTAPSTDVTFEMRYERNMIEVKKSIDIEKLVTRLYLLGYGEGVNQLTIKDVNSGVPYLDADTMSTWGVYASIHQDGTIESADTLKTVGEALLEEYKNPYISYQVKGVDLYPLTGEPFDRFLPGKMGRVNDQEHGILVTARVTEISKKDVRGKPGDIVVTIANKSRSAAETIAELASRMSVSEINAQGQTILYTVQYMDNADKDHPASLPVEIPSECKRINKLRLKMALKPFRNYSKGAASGGGGTTTSNAGGGGATTSESGGGSTSGSSEVLMTSMSTNYTEPAYPSIEGDTGSGGGGNTGSATADVIGVSGSTDGSSGAHVHTSGSYYAGGHVHSGPSHTHGSGSLSVAGHDHFMPHTHGGTSHTHTIYSHTHTVNIPAHSHDVTIPDHTHNNLPGIYEGQTAESVVVTVDGNTVPESDFETNGADLTPYLSKDSNGKILRDTEHTVLITPQAGDGNLNGNTRIEAKVTVMAFIRSQGGGDY